MGLLNLFSSSKDKKPRRVEDTVTWNRLTHIDQIELLTELSKTTPIIIFKHSTRCGTSRLVLNSFIKNYEMDLEAMKLYYLDLLAFRDVSDEVAYRFQVLHQSPQLLVIKNGVVIAYASHYEIQSLNLHQFL